MSGPTQNDDRAAARSRPSCGPGDGSRRRAGRSRLVVVGGGAVGAAVAWEAARTDAATEVVLVDPAPGCGASRVAGGMLAPVTEAWAGEPEVLQPGTASVTRWPGFADAVAADAGHPVGLRTHGTLRVAIDSADAAELDRTVGPPYSWRDRGVERLDRQEVRRREPALGPSVQMAAAVPGDLSVDNRALLDALAAAGATRGVVVCRDRVTRIVDDGERVTGVELTGGFLAADRVVAAAGAWSTTLHPVLADRVRPVKGEVVRLRARTSSTPPPVRTIRAAVDGRPVYIVPRDGGRLVVGATQYASGFDPDVLAGGVGNLIADAQRVLPGIADYALEETMASFRPCTDDNLPLLGPVGPEGLIAATGHGRNGLLLLPITVATLAAVLHGGEMPDLTRQTAADRFLAA